MHSSAATLTMLSADGAQLRARAAAAARGDDERRVAARQSHRRGDAAAVACDATQSVVAHAHPAQHAMHARVVAAAGVQRSGVSLLHVQAAAEEAAAEAPSRGAPCCPYTRGAAAGEQLPRGASGFLGGASMALADADGEPERVVSTAASDDTYHRWRFDDIADGEEEEAVPRASLLLDMHGAFAHALWRAHDDAAAEAAAPSDAEDAVVMRARRG